VGGHDVNLMALGELRSGLARGEQDVLYIKIGTEIGAGLVSGTAPNPDRSRRGCDVGLRGSATYSWPLPHNRLSSGRSGAGEGWAAGPSRRDAAPFRRPTAAGTLGRLWSGLVAPKDGSDGTADPAF